MALVVADFVQENCSTTGTGTYTLAGAVTGFQSFGVIGNTNTTYYAATDGTNWEVGIGTYTTSGTTLARTTILASSNAGAAVNWAGATKISCIYPAELFAANPSIRQTVSAGPVTGSTGLPSFLPATAVSLSLTSQNVSASSPLVITAAFGQVNYTFTATSNLTWSSLTLSNTDYLYVNALTGVTGSTTLVPIYQYGGTPSVTNGQFTFNISEMTGYMGNGASAVATPLVFVGEAVTAVGTVTSTIAYSYNGYYDSGFTATLPAAGSVNSKKHNIGTDQVTAYYIIQNTTAEQGFSIGDRTQIYEIASNTYPTNLTTTRLVVTRTVGNTNIGNIINKSTGAAAVPTAADWKSEFIVKRAGF